MKRNEAFFLSKMAVPPAAWQRVLQHYETDGLYRQTVSKLDRRFFLGFATENLLDGRGDIGRLLTAEAKRRLEYMRPPAPDRPSIRAARPGDERLDCSYMGMQNYLMKHDPGFRGAWAKVKASVYTGGLPSKGTAMRIYRLKQAVKIAMAECRKLQR